MPMLRLTNSNTALSAVSIASNTTFFDTFTNYELAPGETGSLPSDGDALNASDVTIDLNGFTLWFEQTTGGTFTMLPSFTNSHTTNTSSLNFETFTNNGDTINVQGNVNIDGAFTFTDGAGRIRILSDTFVADTFHYAPDGTADHNPIVFAAPAGVTTPVNVNTTFTGGLNEGYIEVSRDISFDGASRNNSDFHIRLMTSDIIYENHRSLLNTAITTANFNYLRFDGGGASTLTYTGTGGYTHPSNLHMTVENTANVVWNNRGATVPSAANNYNYSDMITIDAQFLGHGDITFAGHSAPLVRTRGYRTFKLNGRIISTLNDLNVLNGATLMIEDSTTTTRIGSRNINLFGDLIGQGVIGNGLTLGAKTTVQVTGRLTPGITTGGELTVNGNLALRDGSEVYLSVSDTEIDSIDVQGNLDVPGGTDQVMHFLPLPRAGNLTDSAGRTFISYTGTILPGTFDVDTHTNVYQYLGTNGENKSVIDPDNSEYPAASNDTFGLVHDDSAKELRLTIANV